MGIKESKIKSLNLFKNELKKILGKDSNFSRYDFEKFLKAKYQCKFYNSLKEYYAAKYPNIDVTDSHDFVDCLAFGIVDSNHYRVIDIAYKMTPQTTEALVYYSYEGDHITDIFFQYGELDNQNFWGLFEYNGENVILKNIELYL